MRQRLLMKADDLHRIEVPGVGKDRRFESAWTAASNQMVTLALVQTDLFPDGSAESIAAATKAEQVADDAMGRLPAGTMARKEVERLRIEAVFRAKQFERCDALLNELMLQSNGVVPTRLQALKVRLCIAQGQTELGRKLLNEYFGDVPEAAPQAPEMDLARLEFLLVVNHCHL